MSVSPAFAETRVCGWFGCEKGLLGCAQEVSDGNLAAADRVLSDIGKTSNFNNATKFKAEVARIRRIGDPRSKFQAYLQVMDVRDDDVMDFVSARELRSDWINALERKLGLTQNQSREVVAKLQFALKGQLE